MQAAEETAGGGGLWTRTVVDVGLSQPRTALCEVAGRRARAEALFPLWCMIGELGTSPSEGVPHPGILHPCRSRICTEY